MSDPRDPLRTFDLVERALELPPGDREPFVRREAGPDAGLCDRALELLHEAEAVEGAPEAPPEEPMRLVTSTATAELLARLEGAARFDAARYEVRELLGAGGMGKVLRVEDRYLRRTLAMKQPLAGSPLAADERQRASLRLGRFLEEAQITSQLDHPGIVPVHDLGLDAAGQVYFLMRKVGGQNARDVFAKARLGRDGWTIAGALGVVLKVCETMAYAHRKGVLHRDLKPDNIRVGEYGEVYVMDWGLARIERQDDRHDLRIAAEPSVTSDRQADARATPGSSLVTMDGTVLGTVSYMSPEQANGRTLDHRADIYAIGATLYELLTGKPPYHDGSAQQHDILRRVRKGPPQRIEQLVTGTPAELVAIVDKAMARAPEQRYAHVTELAVDLRAFLEQRVVAAYRTGALAELRLWVRRNRPLAASLAAAALLLVVGVAVATSLARRLAHKVEDFDQVAAVSEHARAIRKEAQLYPAWPHRIAAMEQWLADDCEPLLAKVPAIDRTIASLRALATPVAPGAGVDAQAHPRHAEWVEQGRLLQSLRAAEAIRTGQQPFVAASLSPELLQFDAEALAVAALSRVAHPPERREHWGEEALGLACAELAVARSPGPLYTPYLLRILAQALLANGRGPEAKAVVADALAAAQEESAAAAAGLERLRWDAQCRLLAEQQARIVDAVDRSAALLAAAASDHAALEAEVHTPRPTFAREQQAESFLYATLVELRDTLQQLTVRQAVVAKQLDYARRLAALSLAHPHAPVTWPDVRAAIARSAVYAGQRLELRDEDVLDLVPLGENPQTGLFEFYHLRSAWDGASDPATLPIPARDARGHFVVTGDTGIVFVLLPGGTVRLGSQNRDALAAAFDPQRHEDEPLHVVQLAPFFLARHEVTQGQWARLWLGEESLRQPSQYRDGVDDFVGGVFTRAHPVDSVTWSMADRLLANHGLQLPSEAQWEYACRAGTTTPWVVAEAPQLVRIANLADETAAPFVPWVHEPWRDGHVGPAPVGSFAANAFGLHDMHGNVVEPCRDWYGGYGSERAGDGLRTGVSTERAYRGGSFSEAAGAVRSAHRMGIDPALTKNTMGLRAARALRPER